MPLQGKRKWVRVGGPQDGQDGFWNNWDSGEPSSSISNPDEACVMAFEDGTWNDRICETEDDPKFHYLIEFECPMGQFIKNDGGGCERTFVSRRLFFLSFFLHAFSSFELIPRLDR